jgi:hypothetical protein
MNPPRRVEIRPRQNPRQELLADAVAFVFAPAAPVHPTVLAQIARLEFDARQMHDVAVAAKWLWRLRESRDSIRRVVKAS